MIKKVLVFDTETTGLPPFQILEDKILPQRMSNGSFEKWIDFNDRVKQMYIDSKNEKMNLDKNPKLWDNYKETWPYIVQLSYIIYNFETHETIVKDVYIEIPSPFMSPEYLNDENTHKIVKTAIEAGMQPGVDKKPLEQAIKEFYSFFIQEDTIVTGHNVEFDMNMLLASCRRSGNLEDIFDTFLLSKNNPSKVYCTACKAMDVVKICYSYNCTKNPPIYKMPRLKQAYFRMFGYAPKEEALHNALIDVAACLRVFYRLWFQNIQTGPVNPDTPVCGLGNPDIYTELLSIEPSNPIITIINDFTPEGVEQTSSSNTLTVCEPIDNDALDGLMVGKSEEEIKAENKKTSRLQKYIDITGVNPFAKSSYKRKTMLGGSRKKTKKRRSSKRKSSKRKSSKRRSSSKK